MKQDITLFHLMQISITYKQHSFIKKRWSWSLYVLISQIVHSKWSKCYIYIYIYLKRNNVYIVEEIFAFASQGTPYTCTLDEIKSDLYISGEFITSFCLVIENECNAACGNAK